MSIETNPQTYLASHFCAKQYSLEVQLEERRARVQEQLARITGESGILSTVFNGARLALNQRRVLQTEADIERIEVALAALIDGDSSVIAGLFGEEMIDQAEENIRHEEPAHRYTFEQLERDARLLNSVATPNQKRAIEENDAIHEIVE